MLSTKPHLTYANGREAREFDIVEGVIAYDENPKNPFIGQILSIRAESGVAWIALLRRPKAMARRAPYFALQNLAANAAGLEFRRVSELTLRRRASHVVARGIEQEETGANTRRRYGWLAAELGKRRLPLQVCESAQGFYLGTKCKGQPFSRESEEYWGTREEANEALRSRSKWSQRCAP